MKFNNYNERKNFVENESGIFDSEIPVTQEELESTAMDYFTESNFILMFGECPFDEDDEGLLVDLAIKIWNRDYNKNK